MRKIVKAAVAACAFIMLTLLVAPTSAQAKTWVLESSSEMDQTWGKAYYTYQLVGLPNALSDNVAKRYFKYNVLIDLKDEGSEVPLNGVTKNFNFQHYSADETTKTAVSSVTKRGRYFFWTTHGDDPLPLSRSEGEFYVIGQGSGSLAIDRNTFSPAEAASIPQHLKLVNNTNTDSAQSVVYTYMGVTFSNGGYNSTTAPTQPGIYSAIAYVPSDKANYLHSYTTNSVSFTIESDNFDPSRLESGMYYRDGRKYNNQWTNQDLIFLYKSNGLNSSLTYDLLRNGAFFGSDVTGVSKKPGADSSGTSLLSFDIRWETGRDADSKRLGDSYAIANIFNNFNHVYEGYVKIDKTNPTIDASWSSATGKLKVNAEDDLSGLAVSEVNTKNVSVNGGPWQRADDVRLTKAGSYSVAIRAVDKAGNTETKQMTITVTQNVIPDPEPGDKEDPDGANGGDGFNIQLSNS